MYRKLDWHAATMAQLYLNSSASCQFNTEHEQLTTQKRRTAVPVLIFQQNCSSGSDVWHWKKGISLSSILCIVLVTFLLQLFTKLMQTRESINANHAKNVSSKVAFLQNDKKSYCTPLNGWCRAFLANQVHSIQQRTCQKDAFSWWIFSGGHTVWSNWPQYLTKSRPSHNDINWNFHSTLDVVFSWICYIFYYYSAEENLKTSNPTTPLPQSICILH